MISTVSHSIISESYISELVHERYMVEDQCVCTFLLQGLNDTYLIKGKKVKYIFRLYRYGRRTKEAILSEIEYILHLKQSAAPVAGIISDKDGSSIQTIECPEGTRYGILMHCAANSETETHCILTGNSFNYGKAVAKLHRSAFTFEPRISHSKIDIDHLLWQPLKLVKKTFPERIEDINFLTCVAESLALKISELEEQGLSKIFIHGDLTGGNSCTSSEDGIVFFDFDCCGYGWRSYDLAVFLWSCILCKKEDSLWKNFIDGYRSEIDITDIDLSAVPILAAARHFWIIGYSISQMSIKGRLSYKDKDLEQDINFFKDQRNNLGIFAQIDV